MSVIVWLMAAVSPSSAAILWDQGDFDPSVNALVDQEFTDFPTYSSYMVMDISVGPSGWSLGQLSTFFTHGGDTFSAVTQARLNVFHKVGALPTGADSPVAQSLVPVQVMDFGDHYRMTAYGFLEWLPGSSDYWVGLTPVADFATFGQEFHLAAPVFGADTAWRNPGGSFGVGDQWQSVAAIDTTGLWVGAFDGAFTIEAWIPEPAGLALLAWGMFALPRRRRNGAPKPRGDIQVVRSALAPSGRQ
jgi:hypothetical protein